MKKTVLISVSYLIELEENEINDDEGLLDKITSNNLITSDLNIKVNKEKILLNWECLSSLVLDPENMNCGKCSHCGRWTTDKEKRNPVHSLCYGATVNGRLLCDECLPFNHPHAF